MRNRCSYAGLVSAYFSVYLAGTKNVSTNTIYSYRDTFVIFHGYLEKYCGFKLEKMLFNDLSRELILEFLQYLETERKYSISSRNQRLAALKSFAKYVQIECPDEMILCQRMEPDTRVVMEATGRYHEPVAALLHSEGIFVSILNPLLIKQSGAGSLRKVKSDPKDALKIAKYGLDNWSTLREYTPMEAIRQQLKLCARQCDLYNKNIVMLTNNLISLSDKTFPGVNELFSSPEKADGHLKWVDFYRSFWHCDCINRMSPVQEKGLPF